MNFLNLGSGNGLSPVRRQSITWTNVDLLSTGPSEWNSFQSKHNFSQKNTFWKWHLQNVSTFILPPTFWGMGEQRSWHLSDDSLHFHETNYFEFRYNFSWSLYTRSLNYFLNVLDSLQELSSALLRSQIQFVKGRLWQILHLISDFEWGSHQPSWVCPMIARGIIQKQILNLKTV